MNLQLLLYAVSLGLSDLVNARPKEPAQTEKQCIISEAGRTYIGACTTEGGAPHKVLLNSESCDVNKGERCLVNAMPCSGQYHFYCGNDNIQCFAAPNQYYPDFTGEKLGQGQGICPQDLTCCHGCEEQECDPRLFPSPRMSNQPSIEPEVAGLPSSSPEEFRLDDTAFTFADSTIPIEPNADTLSLV